MAGTHIPLEGAYNFRDLGGHVGAGGRQVRPGRVFRSDRLSGLSEADRLRLEALGIGRVFDLRSEPELSEDGPGEFSREGGRHRHRPLIRVALRLGDRRIDWTKVDLANRYLDMLEQGAPVIREVFEHLAAPSAPPTVFHCTGGKDRTGVVAAVLLRVLGVEDTAIVEDYARSEVHLAPFVEASRERMEKEGFEPEVVLYLCGSPAERMERMLVDLDARWGSLAGYLDWAGVPGDVRGGLRRNLLGNGN